MKDLGDVGVSAVYTHLCVFMLLPWICGSCDAAMLIFRRAEASPGRRPGGKGMFPAPPPPPPPPPHFCWVNPRGLKTLLLHGTAR